MKLLHFSSSKCASRCPNLAVKEAEDDENVEEDDAPVEKTKKVSHAKRKKQTECNLTWIGEPVLVKKISISWMLVVVNEISVMCVQYLNYIFVSTLTDGRQEELLQAGVSK